MNEWQSLFLQRGFQARVARRCGLTRQTVTGWKSAIPVPYCAVVEDECGGQFRRWDFRPDDWHTIWPELVKAKGAPPVPAAEQEGA